MPEEKRPPESGAQGNRLLVDIKEPLLDSHQAAAIFKVHQGTVQRLADLAQIHSVHVGKLWRFRASAIDKWIDI